MRKVKRQRGFKKTPKKFFYQEDIFLSRMASVFKLPQHKVKEIFFQKTLYTIKLNGAEKSTLERKGLELKEVEFCKNTYIVKNKDVTFLKDLTEYKKGLFFVQNLADIIPTLSLDIKDDDCVLDMFPDINTAHIISLVKDQEKLLANTKEKLAEDLDKEYSEYFDKILLVAPSSREGKISFLKKRPLKNWNIKKTKALSKLQTKLIQTGFNCLKKGGLLSYTTNTISPNENEAIVSYLLSKNSNASLENIDLIDTKEFEYYKQFTQKGLNKWNEEVFHKDISKTIRTVPGKTMLGIYTALIRKV